MKEVNITYSELSAMHECRRRHHFAYERLLKPKITPSKLAVGSAGHLALETFFTDGNPDAALEAFDNYINDDLERVKKPNRNLIKTETEAASVRAALQLYLGSQGLEDYKRYEFIELEKKFKIPIVNPDSRRKLPKAFYSGKIDAVVRDRQLNGALAVMEHKFLAAFDDNINILAIDMQITMYAYAVGRLLGEFPAMVVYNVLQKPRYKRTETKIENSDEKILEDLQSYSERVYSLIQKKPESYLKHATVTRNASDYRIIEEELYHAARERRKKNPYHWRNVGPHCSWKCAFKEICFHEDEQLMEEMYETKSSTHEELNDEEKDKVFHL